MFDLLIRNGTVVDGTGQPRFQADVGIEGDRITLVGRANGAEAQCEIDAAGKIVCPGFIDPHSHADLSLMRENQAALLEPLVRQGITTFVGGNCGMAMAPIQDKNRGSIETYLEIFTRLDFEKDVQWKTMGQYFDKVEARGLLLNAAILAPHGLLRLTEIGSEMRLATDSEVESMARALDQALGEGAAGLSTGLQYVPGSQSDTTELIRLGAVCKKHGAIFTSHLRSYSNTLDKAIDEVIEVADRNGIRAQISHMFWVPDYGVFGPLMRKAIRGLARLSKWWTVPIPIDAPMQQRINQMLRARERGVEISMDVMPTTSGFTHILAFFPLWSLAGTQRDVLKRLKDPAIRKQILHSIEHGKMTWPHTGGEAWTLNLFRLMGWECARIMSVASEKNKRLEGMDLVSIARERGVHPLDAACDLLLEEQGHVLVFESMAEPGDAFTERSMFAGLKHPEVMISTDAILMGSGQPSSLFYGCYPHFLSRFVREKKMLTIETAIRKSTGLPAEHFRLEGRGKIKEKACADVVVFDLGALASRATFFDPANFPVGIEHVIINGKHVVDQGTFRPDPLPGRLLRHGK
jgi:N-acyl-D-aspartate/D-glutamate deacylase